MEVEDVAPCGIQIQLSTSQERRRELVQALVAFRSRVAAEDGTCEIFEDLSRPNGFLWLQWWPSRERLEEHLRSGRLRLLLGAIEVLGHLESAWIVERSDCASLERVV